MKGRQLTDVSRRRFDVSQSPVQLQGSPDFGRLRDSSSPFSSLLLLFPSFLRQPRPPSFQLLRSHPFSSVNEPVERKGERVVEQRESKLRPVPGYFLSLPLTRARRFSLPLFLFFSSLPPFPFSFCPPLPPSSISPDFSPQSEKRTETFDSRNQWHYYYYQFTLFIVRDNEEQREGGGGGGIGHLLYSENW